jgi:hypothetical protein
MCSPSRECDQRHHLRRARPRSVIFSTSLAERSRSPPDFSDTSEIAAAIGDASDGDDENTVDTETQSFFENFADEVTTPFFSLLLPRDNTTASSIGLGTVMSNMTKITSAPKLAVIGDTWLVELTSEAVLVNGRNISLPVPVFEDGENLTALFDSGFANSFVSR